jgi:hypothetical protein
MTLYFFNDTVVAGKASTKSVYMANLVTATALNAGFGNTVQGHDSGIANTSGYFNTFCGMEAGKLNTTGFANTFIGYQAGSKSVNTRSSVYIGSEAGRDTTADYNTFVGAGSGIVTTTGADNSFFGINSGAANTTGQLNVFFGELAGNTNTTGSFNTYIGLFAGSGYTTGSNNTVIGTQNKDATAVNGSNNTFIGANLTGYGAVSNIVIVADGSGNRAFTADTAAFRPRLPVRMPSYTVATLPSAGASAPGAIAYTTNGRILSQTAGNGTGCTVYSDGSIWKRFATDTQVLA